MECNERWNSARACVRCRGEWNDPEVRLRLPATSSACDWLALRAALLAILQLVTPRRPRDERYTIASELGRGGMGVVFAAFDNLRQRPVALKRLATARFNTESELERATTLFEREYHTLSQLAHPHVISVFDYGLDEQGPFYSMEQLRGESLRACAPLPWREAARIVRDVASALAIVHSRRLVHRDVTPHNIYYAADSGAKLFDFGAMIPMGVAKQLVGTPSFIAPECLKSQPLDGQTDLFALGACLYYALSGRNAYPARGIEALARAWETPPPPLSRFCADIPEALEAFVESLLSIAPSGRPRTAADVYERLTSIADLPRSESLEVVRAYVTKPALVARERELAYLRKRAQRAAKGRGNSVIIASPAGLGRTRLLDASVLEAQLAGLRVARADASDSQLGSFGAIRRALQSLQETGLDVVGALQKRELAAVLTSNSDAPLSTEQRDQTLRELPGVLIELSQSAPLAFAVDDLQAIDEPSIAVLAGLAAQARGRSIAVVATLDLDSSRRPPALRLLLDSSRRVTLQPLDEDQSHSLLSSVFGEAPNLEVFARLCHRRCLGNPRRLMESAQAAIDAKLARYEGGGWAITSDTSAIAVTLDRNTDIEQQLAALSADAFELLEAMACDREGILGLVDYPFLTEHGDNTRMHRALNELVDAGWLMIHSDRARFRRDDQRALVEAHVPDARARAMHGRIARRCSKPGLAPVYATYHFVKAGEPELALEPMDEMSRYVEAHPSSELVRSSIAMETLQLFSEMPDMPGAHPGARGNYAAAFVVNSTFQGLPERAAPWIERAFAEIARFTGVSDYRELSALPESERLSQALARANERCQSPGFGGLDLLRLLRRQTQLCLTTGVCANFLADPSLLDPIPDIRPYAPLSPALAVAVQVLDGLSKQARGQSWLAWDVFDEVHAWMFSEAAEAIDGLTLIALRVSTLGYLCALETEHATPKTLLHLDQYAQYMPHNAQSMRARYYLACGDVASSIAARKESELLSLQSNSLPETRNTETASYLGMYSLSDDLLGLRRVCAELTELAATRQGWRFRLTLAQCQILRCQNRCEEALSIAEASLSRVPTLHIDFVAAAATHLELLLATERFEAARHAALQYLERAREGGAPSFRIELALAQACAELGSHSAAHAYYASAMRALESRQVHGLLLGRAIEMGARIALRQGDAKTFRERADLAVHAYALKQNPSLAPRFATLMRDAARAGLIIVAEAAPNLVTTAAASTGALKELASITDDSGFYAGALEFLIRRSGANAAFLYVPSKDGLRRVAGTNLHWTDTSALDQVATEHYERERAGEALETSDLPTQIATASHTHGTGMTLWPCVLARPNAAGRTIEGVVVFVSSSLAGAGIPRSSLEELATLMTSRSDSTVSVRPGTS
jgi:hypothetical protein